MAFLGTAGRAAFNAVRIAPPAKGLAARFIQPGLFATTKFLGKGLAVTTGIFAVDRAIDGVNGTGPIEGALRGTGDLLGGAADDYLKGAGGGAASAAQGVGRGFGVSGTTVAIAAAAGIGALVLTRGRR